MRPGLSLSFGTLALLLALGCSSRGGDSLFSGDMPHDGIDDGEDGAGGDDTSGEDGQDAGEGETPDAGDEVDAGDEEDAGDGAIPSEGGVELPSVTLACGNSSCTTPDEYCCIPGANVGGVQPSCKASDAECKVGWGNVNLVSGIPQHCAAHEHCAGGQCCAIRASANADYTSIECRLECKGAEVEFCDPKNPDCSEGSCKESTRLRNRGVYVCQP